MSLPPNHHAGEGSFAGLPGILLGLGMALLGGANARLVNDAAGVVAGDRVVDVGCGPGNAAREAARRGADVIGIEPAPTLRRLAERLTSAAVRVAWMAGLAEALPLADDSATVVWSVRSVHHWPDLSGGIREALRVLAPGGRLVVVEKTAKEGAKGLASHGWTEAQARDFARMLGEAGFVDAKVDERASGFGRSYVVTARRTG